ncbi:MAG: hypothetical protein HYT13_01090 [Candidatus Liptonbacteria bacterium]|nr:hypothetical protein [Candidatus Liptonbacteria bacterium]
MAPEIVKQKMGVLMNPCPCGSGKMFYMCCGGEQAGEIADEKCACGSGKMVKDCCMKSPDTHQKMV